MILVLADIVKIMCMIVKLKQFQTKYYEYVIAHAYAVHMNNMIFYLPWEINVLQTLSRYINEDYSTY